MKAMVKMEIVKEFRLHNRDTSSVDVEIGLLTEKIRDSEEEFQKTHNLKVRKILIEALARRNRLLNYLRSTNVDRYKTVMHKILKLNRGRYEN